MKKTTAKNEIQVVLEEYLGRTKATEVAEAVYAVMHAETQHTHNSKSFFVNEDSNGNLVLTMESMVKKQVEAILSQNLEKDKVQNCLEQLVEIISTEKQRTTDIATIFIEGSDSQIYSELLKYTPSYKVYGNDREKFLEDLKKAVDSGVKAFNVPVYDPSIDENGSLQFIAGRKPAVGYSYNELKELASKNGIRLGSKNQYILFIATIIHRLINKPGNNALNPDTAFYITCCNYTKLRKHSLKKSDVSFYIDNQFPLTGSDGIVGKYDLSTSKILVDDEKPDVFWRTWIWPSISSLSMEYFVDEHYEDCVGWFVL